jgi:hypothetical protein
MIVIPGDVIYQPFTYIWTLGVGRFPDGLRRRISRETALREIARCFLLGAGLTIPGELARVTGLSRPNAGLGAAPWSRKASRRCTRREPTSCDSRPPDRSVSLRVGMNSWGLFSRKTST